ncbi:hypothetical protein ERIC1_1c06670 [Paenibacillus larvae subsp. larvae DSM 25719]|uniref:Helix-turn-helix XRE family transcriptional regulator n=1 Tax=Paenibacillus phage Dragolir TaxID=2070190 RepID=A0A2I7SC17_9CAUD|nr:helix-turn-helix XRE family transcriptional regulator [Paenibacillus phage Dragolir]AUS03441.1 helix-turn-helix XRE family transcriptional regulator [Paenibacillus phage Dragolir]ETK27224.1 hypothetical protein ERIC1_1c06670 [Paenibacillus larvae subsp. larvae DSM 25719]
MQHLFRISEKKLLTLKPTAHILDLGFENETKEVTSLKQIKRRHVPYTKFKAFLDETGVNQKKVAELLGKSTSAFNQNLNGTGGDFSVAELRVICEQFNISADEYFLRPGVSKMKQKLSKELESEATQ